MRTFSHDEEIAVVVGSGPGGATVALRLAQAGLPVVVLEAGPWLSNDDFVNDEREAFTQLSWLEPRVATGSWTLARDFSDLPAWNGRAVGGTALLWTGLTPRFKRHELVARSTYGEVNGAALADWPLSLSTLQPYYDEAEQALGVSHRHGRPPMPANANYHVFANGADRIGFRHYATGPYATNVEPYDGRPGSVQDGFNSQGDKSRAKWTPLVSEIPKAVATGRAEVRPDSTAVRITLDRSGRANAVEYIGPDGRMHTQKASVVVVAGNSIETPRLLMLSATPAHPDGLGNGSGQLGRNYMRHTTGVVYGQFEQDVHMYKGENMAGIVADESRHDPERGFVGGYYLEMISQGLPSFSMFMDPTAWGRDFTERIEAYTRTAACWICGEDMPQANNRVTLSSDSADRFGLPVPVVHYDDHPNDLAMRDHACGRVEEMFGAVGATRIWRAPAMPSGHNLGTARMSASAAEGVVDPNLGVHGVPGLYIGDGSVFTTGAAANPTLTIVALAMRLGDHLIDRRRTADV